MVDKTELSNWAWRLFCFICTGYCQIRFRSSVLNFLRSMKSFITWKTIFLEVHGWTAFEMLSCFWGVLASGIMGNISWRQKSISSEILHWWIMRFPRLTGCKRMILLYLDSATASSKMAYGPCEQRWVDRRVAYCNSYRHNCSSFKWMVALFWWNASAIFQWNLSWRVNLLRCWPSALFRKLLLIFHINFLKFAEYFWILTIRLLVLSPKIA